MHDGEHPARRGGDGVVPESSLLISFPGASWEDVRME